MMKEKSILFILFLFIIIYFAQGTLYPTGSIISQASLFLWLGISAIYLFKTFFDGKKKELFYKTWTALLLLNVIGFVFTGYISNASHFGMFKGILISSLPFYPFYYFSRSNILKSNHLRLFFLVMFVISIIQFYYNREQVLATRLSNNPDVVNNAAYMFVNLIPFVFLIKKNRLISVVGMLIIVFYIIQGAKRGALITGIVGVMIYIYYQFTTIDKKYRIGGYALSIILLSITLYFTYTFYTQNEFLIQRMNLLSEQGFSGRDRIYATLINEWYLTDNIFNFLFGYGFAGSLNITGGLYAHNDWLELLSNFGVFGVSVYLLLFYSAYKLIRDSKFDSDKKIIFIAVILMWFLVTLFSMGYTSTGGYLRAIMLAYLIGSRSRGIAM